MRAQTQLTPPFDFFTRKYGNFVDLNLRVRCLSKEDAQLVEHELKMFLASLNLDMEDPRLWKKP